MQYKKLLKTAINVILYVWQLPQNLLGLLLIWYMGGTRIKSNDTIFDTVFIVSKKMKGGISLGKYIILSKRSNNSKTRLHELGHTIQSKMLGPLYLIVIGLFSLIHAMGWSPEKGDYYSYWTEAWANKLAKKYIWFKI